MRLRDYLLAVSLALVVVAIALGIDAARSAERHAAVAAEEFPLPAPQLPAAQQPDVSVTMVYDAPCGKAAEILQVQREVFGQVPAGTGTVDQGTSLILLVSPSGSWSVVALIGSGRLACGMASGGDWRSE